jgi:hypothetical protein
MGGKHSPGPWRWVYADGGQIEGPLGRFVDANGEVVCDFGSDTQYYPTAGTEPSDANARLIAAGPEMYEAIRVLLQEVGNPSSTNARAARALLARVDEGVTHG